MKKAGAVVSWISGVLKVEVTCKDVLSILEAVTSLMLDMGVGVMDIESIKVSKPLPSVNGNSLAESIPLIIVSILVVEIAVVAILAIADISSTDVELMASLGLEETSSSVLLVLLLIVASILKLDKIVEEIAMLAISDISTDMELIASPGLDTEGIMVEVTGVASGNTKVEPPSNVELTLCISVLVVPGIMVVVDVTTSGKTVEKPLPSSLDVG